VAGGTRARGKLSIDPAGEDGYASNHLWGHARQRSRADNGTHGNRHRDAQPGEGLSRPLVETDAGAGGRVAERRARGDFRSAGAERRGQDHAGEAAAQPGAADQRQCARVGRIARKRAHAATRRLPAGADALAGIPQGGKFSALHGPTERRAPRRAEETHPHAARTGQPARGEEVAARVLKGHDAAAGPGAGRW